MAPPEHPFPVHELEKRVHYHTVNFKEKNRKLGDFDLKRDCELFELVQYSCTTEQQQRIAVKATGTARMECYPFVRLFRRCGTGNKMFHVETTAWEGEHAWKPSRTANLIEKPNTEEDASQNWILSYLNNLWPNK